MAAAQHSATLLVFPGCGVSGVVVRWLYWFFRASYRVLRRRARIDRGGRVAAGILRAARSPASSTPRWQCDRRPGRTTVHAVTAGRDDGISMTVHSRGVASGARPRSRRSVGDRRGGGDARLSSRRARLPGHREPAGQLDGSFIELLAIGRARHLSGPRAVSSPRRLQPRLPRHRPR